MASIICTAEQCPTIALRRFSLSRRQNFDFTIIALNSATGYIMEVDVKYLQHLHEEHTDRFVRRARNHPVSGMISFSQHYATSSVTSYIILQKRSHHGLRITKVHCILQFAQFPWLRDYIELNTKFRILVKNDFEKNLYELIMRYLAKPWRTNAIMST